MTRTEALAGTVLVVAASAETDALLRRTAVAECALSFERAADAVDAINRVDGGERADVVLLDRGLEDPVRVAQRLHSLDREGAVVVLTDARGEPELRRALSIAPFLKGDVTLLETGDPAVFIEHLSAAAARTRTRREEVDEQKKRRATPPPLSASYLGTLLDSVPIGLVTMDASAAVIGWNRRAGEMLETPEVEALGRPFAELFDDEDGPRLAGLIERFGSAGIGGEAEVFERHGRAFELTGARFTIRTGEPGTLLILQDVTGRRQAEREVELQRALMAAQADSSVVGIAVVSLDGSLERMNRRWTEIWGVDADLVRADRARATELMLEQVVDPDGFMAGIERLAASSKDYKDEIDLKDGRVIERYATHVRVEGGEVIGRIWFHTDITAHRREEDALRFLAEATNVLSSSLDYQTTLKNLNALIVPRLADACTIVFAEGDTSSLVRTSEGGDSEMVIPIKVREHVFGTLRFLRTSPTRPFVDDDVQLAEELARRAAIAIDNARVHAELRDTARTLQESLLPPHLPAVRGFELAARFRPAASGVQVGGDFYDIFETGSDQWGVVVGDVCGKGAEAAALTALTRYTVRAAAMYEEGAGGVIRVLNEALLRQRSDYRFTTVAYCVLDVETKPYRLRASSAGHPRPLLLHADGSVEMVGATGPLAGVVQGVDFKDEEVELGEGDVLVLYTDGVTDALAPEHMLDEHDLMAALADCGGLSAGEIAQRLEDVALGDDPTHPPRDDMAIVVVKLD